MMLQIPPPDNHFKQTQMNSKGSLLGTSQFWNSLATMFSWNSQALHLYSLTVPAKLGLLASFKTAMCPTTNT
jgi:hypothetical protein